MAGSIDAAASHHSLMVGTWYPDAHGHRIKAWFGAVCPEYIPAPVEVVAPPQRLSFLVAIQSYGEMLFWMKLG
jgi:hypothetical protein